jgi:hypothetical protein
LKRFSLQAQFELIDTRNHRGSFQPHHSTNPSHLEKLATVAAELSVKSWKRGSFYSQSRLETPDEQFPSYFINIGAVPSRILIKENSLSPHFRQFFCACSSERHFNGRAEIRRIDAQSEIYVRILSFNPVDALPNSATRNVAPVGY